MHYIKSVALAWHQAGITTVSAAKQESNNYHRDYYIILKAFGISNRNPIDSEIEYMNCWLKEYTMPVELIVEACNRTILQTGKPQFSYAQTILADWYKKKVCTLNDIKPLDFAHKKNMKPNSPTQHKKGTNKFNDFPQRSYDYNELEKHLLSK
jgi:DnaD/phage-associated family protein